MEWRQQSSVSCAEAFSEAQRWIEEVTGKSFGSNDFRAALENGVLLCDLINQLKPGIIKKLNRLSTPIAGLDNVNAFLKACDKLGLNESQLFHTGDLQDLSTRVTLRRDESNRRLKNVLITIYWLGRKANIDPVYNGPQLNFKAFEGLLGLALSKTLDESGNATAKDTGYKECWYAERDEFQSLKPDYVRENSTDSESRVVRFNTEGCGSDAEADQVFRVERSQRSDQQNKTCIPPTPVQRKQGWDPNRTSSTHLLTSRAYPFQVRPGRPVQVNPGWIWSKSLNDIPMVYPVYKVYDEDTAADVVQDTDLAREWNFKNRQRSSICAKDSEAKWQDDLTKWKNRRRSMKNDCGKKLQDREHVVAQMTNGAVTDLEQEAKQSELLKRSDVQPHTWAVLSRSSATEKKQSSHVQGSVIGAASDGRFVDEMDFSSLTSGGVDVTTASLESRFSLQVKPECFLATNQPTDELGQLGNGSTDHTLSPIITVEQTDPVKSSNSKKSAEPVSCQNGQSYTDTKGNTSSNVPEGFSHLNHNSQEESKLKLCEQVVEDDESQQSTSFYRCFSQPGLWSRSASLPRGFRRAEGSSRFSGVITARPFGPNSRAVPQLFHCAVSEDNQNLLLNSKTEESLTPSKFMLKRQTGTSQMTNQYKVSVGQNKANQATLEEGEQREEGKGVSPSSQTNGYHHQPCAQTQPERYPNVQSQNDNSLTLLSRGAPDWRKMDHSDMKVHLSLKPNSKPKFGFKIHWDSTGTTIQSIQPGSPAELCQLCVDDEIVAVEGFAVANMSYNQWKNKMTSALKTGSMTMDIRRSLHKDQSTSDGNRFSQKEMTLSLTDVTSKLLSFPGHHDKSSSSMETTVEKTTVTDGQITDKTKKIKCSAVYNSWVYLCGGSESAISDIQVPSLSSSSSSWSWDRDEDRRRQEKWQKEQERLLQEQCQHNQERLEAEWRRAQQDVFRERCTKLQNTSEMPPRAESLASSQLRVNGLAVTNKSRKCERSPETEELREYNPQNDAKRVQKNKIPRNDWPEDHCGFGQLSAAHRAKSLSTSSLAGLHKQTRADQKKKALCLSKAEKERQQILEEMKKRTQLLTDNSWIRQRSSSTYKEPIYIGVPMKRYESLDNLDTLRQSPLSTSTVGCFRPHSAADYVPTRNASSRYTTGSSLSHSRTHFSEDTTGHLLPGNEPADQSMPTSHHGRVVSGKRICCVCERVLGRGAAMVIEALGLCFHLACFQCVGCRQHLGGTDTGVQVRIRNRKAYCEPCYLQLK
ncbi:LIM domain only protein 7b [Thalassophryne amazonica]|uniref:LIM domain only protein 7b n=1 Tax=Thalassophryne amazonica TaxID=390379 RepID=UPI0014712C1C|nr:LIM domain only protein 7b [Thalassophryne amazonica]